MQRLLTLMILWMAPFIITAQQTCISKTEVYELLSPGGIESQKGARQDEAWIEKRLTSAFSSSQMGSAPVLTIPIVFHVVTENGTGISQSRLSQSVEWLNDAFRNQGFYDPTQGVDVEIEFCLSRQDPEGEPTDGITRTTSDLGNIVIEFQDGELKDLIRWDTRDYLNVWVVDNIRSFSLGDGVAGYATFPAFHASDRDGIVIEELFFGVTEEENSVLAHEVGHYLGLYHTFEGGCQNDDCNRDGDLVCDTPPDQSTGYVPCDETMNTCQTDVNSGFAQDQDDMTRNYMDYSRLACYNQFSPLQKERMRFFLETTRQSLLFSPGCQDLCTDNISTEIVLPPLPHIVCDSLEWSTMSIGVANYDWYVNGEFLKSGENVRIWFDQPGIYEVAVEARNADGNCRTGDTVRIEVRCDFTVDLITTVEPCYQNAGPLTFEVVDVPGTTTTWFIGNQEVGTGSRLTFPFVNGAYELTTKVNDGKCSEELTFQVLVGCREICNNGVDDDGDGLFDCFDPDCCDECPDYYFQACSPAYEDCLPTQELSIRNKWDSEANYLSVFSLVSGDIDGDGEVEIITHENPTGFIALDASGNQKTVIGLPDGERVNWVMPMAIADIEGDGTAELFYFNLRDRLVSAEHDGTLRWVSEVVTSPNGSFKWDPVHVIDSDLDGNAEVVLAYSFYDAATGQFLGRPGPEVPLAFPGGQYVFADILPDNACPDCEGLELINGSQVVSISDDFSRFDVVTTNSFRSGGHASVVDWDLDGDLDVIGSFSGRITIWDGQTGTIIQDVNTFQRIGNATASNFDEDPEPELVVIPQEDDFVLAYDNDLQSMWVAPIVGSSGINPMCFDFEFDGKNEIVLRDQENLIILNGETGDRRVAIPCESITNDERPIITDIDGDGHAELLTSCTIGSIRNGSPAQVSCFEGNTVEWPKTRPVVPNYSNFHSGFNDDLTIPTYAQQHQLPMGPQDLNSSMTQVAIPEEPDTLEFSAVLDSFSCTGEGTILVQLTICNSGTRDINNLDISFYNGSPLDVGTQRILTLNIDVSGLDEKDCITERFDISNPLGFPTNELCIIINDPGTRNLPFDFLDELGFEGPGECDYLNNIICPILPDIGTSVSVADQFICGNDSTRIILDDVYAGYQWSTGETTPTINVIDTGRYWVEVIGPCGGSDRDTFNVIQRNSPTLILPDSITVCSSQVVNLTAPPGFKSYRWQDNRREPSYTVFNPGIYWVEVIDSCDVIIRDSSIVVFEEEVDLGLPDSLDICPGDTVSLSIFGFNDISWSPNENIDCNNCETVQVYPRSSTWYFAFVNTTEGCFASDSTLIKVEGEISFQDTILTCRGDSITYKNERYGPGNYNVSLPSGASCDTIIELAVINQEADTISEIIPICFGDSLQYRGQFYQPGDYEITVSSTESCDTVFQLRVLERPQIDATLITTPSCAGDSTGTAVVSAMVSGTRLVANWSNGIVLDDTSTTGLSPGSYAVIVIDELNCTRRFEFEIGTVAPADFNINLTLDSCASGGGFAIEIEGDVEGELRGPGTNTSGDSFFDLSEGLYQLSISDTNGCFVTDTAILLEPLSQFVFEIQDSIVISPGETANVPILGSLSDISFIQWEDEDGLLCIDCPFLEANPVVTTTYTVEIVDDNGCSTVLEVVVVVDGTVGVYVPNVFSPNGDNINDQFRPYSNVEGGLIISFEVYSRWGSLLYKEDNKTIGEFNGWDGSFNGEVLSPDVFIYMLSYEIGDFKEARSGSITLVK